MLLAMDLGGTWCRVACFERLGERLRAVRRLPTRPERGFFPLLEELVAASRALLGGMVPTGVGVAAPGPLDPKRGVLLRLPNLPQWPEALPLAELLAERLGAPTRVDNDANLAALGEHRFGAGRGVDHLVYLTVSTGIGGGIISGGRLLHGVHGFAGEVGHQVILPDGPPCGCGGRGCLEVLASGTAIVRRAQAAGLPADRLAEEGAAAVFAAAAAGDPRAQEVIAGATRALGLGVVNLLHVFDPALVVLGGGVTQAGEALFGPVRAVVASLAMPGFRETPILPAALGDEAGLYGAAVVAAEA
ncbi:MAG: ROK family protein [Chloroflexi bacterium]|nr:ROK family protein [Chloroflexota bacterium]